MIDLQQMILQPRMMPDLDILAVLQKDLIFEIPIHLYQITVDL